MFGCHNLYFKSHVHVRINFQRKLPAAGYIGIISPVCQHFVTLPEHQATLHTRVS